MVLKLGCQMTALPQDSSIEGYIRAVSVPVCLSVCLFVCLSVCL